MQVFVPEPHALLQLVLEPDEHDPSPLHDPQLPHEQLELQVRVFVPQYPQEAVPFCPGVHSPEPGALQAPQEHDELQVFVPEPHVPLQLVLFPGEQLPWPLHEPQLPQEQLELQVRVWDPQLPQPCVCFWPGEHVTHEGASSISNMIRAGLPEFFDLNPATPTPMLFAPITSPLPVRMLQSDLESDRSMST